MKATDGRIKNKGKSKYDRETFLSLYIPLKMKGMSVRKIADEIGVSPVTLQTYKRTWIPTVAEPDKLKKAIIKENMVEAENRMEYNETLIDTAYKLHLQGIQTAIKDNDYKTARDISIEALKIAKTEAEIKRTFSLLVDNRQVNIMNINDVPPEVMDSIRLEMANEVINHFRGKLCERCRRLEL